MHRRPLSGPSQGLLPLSRRAWGIVLAFLLVVMCVLIAWGQWYAIHVNVPRLESRTR
jgi:hypothetical protein